MNLRKLVLVIIGIVSFSVFAQIPTPPPPPPTLPPVTVTAPTVTGGSILCTGEACGWVVQSMSIQWNQDQLDSQKPEEDFIVDNTKFCRELRANRPSNCSMSSPPPSPGLSSSWQPNGCGSGAWSNALASAVQSAASPDTYSGDLDAPYSGVSFRNACDGHDKCYAEAMDKGSCDMSFFNDMMQGCSGVSDASGRSSCEGFSATYFGTVSNSPLANLAAITSAAERTCALWVYDMQNNGCGESE